ncbi:MAG: hypothetical protein LBI15_02850 [Dysgonamonadaceae bacterium]|jgi:hypothetical protein|nr:hypothetical protein [Dysgonamonadaceae bacterium]
MQDYSKYNDILIELRTLLFAGKEFDDNFIKIYKNRNKNKITESNKDSILENLISRAKNDFVKLPIQEIQFPEIKELMELIKTINNQFLISEQAERYSACKLPLDKLNGQLRKGVYDVSELKSSITALRKEAKAWENEDNRYRLFDVLRNYANLCETLILTAQGDVRLLLSPDLVDIVLDINSNINKTDFTPFKYKELSEKHASDRSLRSIPEDKRFRVIITLISLKCKDLKIDVPTLSSTITCSSCGKKVPSENKCAECENYLKCPGCGGTIAKGKCIGCGIEIENIKTWLSKIKDANKKLSAGDYESAEQLINPIKTKWAKNENIATIISKIADLRKKVADCEKTIDECIVKSNYFAAQRCIDETKRLVILSDNIQAKEKNIRQKIEQAKSFVEAGDRASLPIQKIENYAQAISLVADFDKTINKLKQQNILVANLICKANGKQVQLSWDKITANSLTFKYIIHREDITNRKAKIEITQTPTSNFTDTIEGGISYFYYVQIQYIVNGTNVSDVWDEVKSQEIIVPDETADCRAIAGDKRVRIEFTPNPNAADYELHRTDEAGKKEILKANLRSGSFTDMEVKNGIRYTYTLITVFKKSSGEIIRSAGITMYATPIVPPEPIQSLDYFKNGEIITFSWDAKGKSNDCFRILHSTNPINKPVGFNMSLAELEKLGKVIIPLTSTKTECILLNHVLKNYFSIWSTFGDTAIAGSEIEILNVTEVSNVKAYISSGKIYIEWDWPPNCQQVRVSYSNNSFTDSHKTVKNYPRERYDKQKAYVIDNPILDKDYYIEIATQNFDGKQEMVSSGIRIKLANSNPMTIKYALKVSSFLRKKLTLKIENDNSNRLPELILVSSPSRIPVRKEDGAVIYVIPDNTACGTFELSNEHIRKNCYARLFLSDTSIKNIKIITPNKEQLKLF